MPWHSRRCSASNPSASPTCLLFHLSPKNSWAVPDQDHAGPSYGAAIRHARSVAGFHAWKTEGNPLASIRCWTEHSGGAGAFLAKKRHGERSSCRQPTTKHTEEKPT